MRVILGTRAGGPVGPASPVSPAGDLDDATLAGLYACPARGSWWRANMIASLDGAVAGSDGLSGSLHTRADNRVFGLLRALADVVVVGAGTVRDEGYRSIGRPAAAWRHLRDGRSEAAALVVVSASGRLPERVEVAGMGDGEVFLATCPGVDTEAARARLGDDHVLVAGSRGSVDPTLLRAHLAELGFTRALIEGGPGWLRAVVAAGALDELCLTLSPMLVAGNGPRLLNGEGVHADARPTLLLEDDATLLGRWAIDR